MISRSGRGGLKAAWFIINIFASTSSGFSPLANRYPHLLVISALRWPSITGAKRSRGGSLRLPTGFLYFGFGVMACFSLPPSGNRCSNAASKSHFQIYCPNIETLGGAMTKPPFDLTSTPSPIPCSPTLNPFKTCARDEVEPLGNVKRAWLTYRC